jgi:hypothetical protein
MATVEQRLARAEAMIRQLQGGLGFYMRLENDVANAFTNNATVKVPMDTAVYDPYEMVDLANDWAVIPRAGWWLFEGGALQTAAFSTGAVTYQTYVIGSTPMGAAVLDTYFPSKSTRKILKGAVLLRCDEGDQMYVAYFQNTGAALTADGLAGDFNYLRGLFLAP